MLIPRRFIATIALLMLVSGAASAQEAAGVVASATAEGVRFTSPGQTAGVRLEIYGASGERLFDSGPRQGGILDWKAADAGHGLADGSYLYAVTTTDPGGREQKRFGTLSVQGGRVSAAAAVEDGLKAAQAAAEQAAPETATAAAPENSPRAATVTAHDGRDGQVTSTSGALTFRTGDTFSGEDKEQMRVTADGRVGIGTDSPEATLDVAGTIRARGGIRFDDGSVLTSAAAARFPAGSAGGAAGAATDDTTANVAGTGTANNLAKWVDGAGTLGNSAVSEVGGNVGIGTAAPSTPLEVVYNDNTFKFGMNIRNTNAGSNSLIGYGINNAANSRIGQFVYVPPTYIIPALRDSILFSSVGATTKLGFVSSADGTGSPDIYFRAGNNNPNSIHIVGATGNVGVGTSAPTQKLEVAGKLKLSGAGNGIVFPDGTTMTTAGGAGSMSGTSIVSAINDPATAGSINDNRLSPNVARLNGANAWSGSNTFGAGLSANNALVTNVGNPVNAGDAVNKAYADANFVKFVPGAEQLSVGDANGTAPMINLRGGSTCCSGPGGHTPAFFKVFQNGSFVATGNLGIGTSPMEGKGYRTSWHTYKGAFRSGYADNEWDDANVGFFSWSGGSNSTASGLYALAFGDTNFARSTSSIAFGSGNEVKGAAGFSAGAGNRVCDTYGVALGNNAKSGGPYIDGKCDPETFNIRGLAAVAIGYNVTADQDHTTAMGKFASNNGFHGTFIWSDGAPQASADTFRNTANNEFAARATGGFRFRTNLGGTTGCNLPAGSGVFNCTSSRTTKENFLSVSGEDVLSRLRKVPVSSWNYISEGVNSRHLGPMAEDFHAAFGLGTSDKAIGVQDAVGVSLAAVKALDERTAELQRKTAEVEQLRDQVNSLERRLAALEQALQTKAGEAGRQ